MNKHLVQQGYTMSIPSLVTLPKLLPPHAANTFQVSQLAVGDMVDVQDTEGDWFAAQITEKGEIYVKCHFLNCSSKWDCMISLNSSNFAPIHTHTKKTVDFPDHIKPLSECVEEVLFLRGIDSNTKLHMAMISKEINITMPQLQKFLETSVGTPRTIRRLKRWVKKKAKELNIKLQVQKEPDGSTEELCSDSISTDGSHISQTKKKRKSEKKSKCGFTCPYPECNQQFRRKPLYTAHIKVKHLGWVWKCPLCIHEYASKGNLGRHCRTSHEGQKVDLSQALKQKHGSVGTVGTVGSASLDSSSTISSTDTNANSNSNSNANAVDVTMKDKHKHTSFPLLPTMPANSHTVNPIPDFTLVLPNPMNTEDSSCKSDETISCKFRGILATSVSPNSTNGPLYKAKVDLGKETLVSNATFGSEWEAALDHDYLFVMKHNVTQSNFHKFQQFLNFPNGLTKEYALRLVEKYHKKRSKESMLAGMAGKTDNPKTFNLLQKYQIIMQRLSKPYDIQLNFPQLPTSVASKSKVTLNSTPQIDTKQAPLLRLAGGGAAGAAGAAVVSSGIVPSGHAQPTLGAPQSMRKPVDRKNSCDDSKVAGATSAPASTDSDGDVQMLEPAKLREEAGAVAIVNADDNTKNTLQPNAKLERCPAGPIVLSVSRTDDESVLESGEDMEYRCVQSSFFGATIVHIYGEVMAPGSTSNTDMPETPDATDTPDKMDLD